MGKMKDVEYECAGISSDRNGNLEVPVYLLNETWTYHQKM
jgi:hypothetical protein